MNRRIKEIIVLILLFLACTYKMCSQSLREYTPSASFVFAAGLSDGLRDASMYRMDSYPIWMNGKQSWVLKYKNRDIKQGAAFFGSTSFFVGITDLPHASNVLTHQFEGLAEVLMPDDNNKRFWHLMLKIAILNSIRQAGHFIIYDVAFHPQGRD